MGITSDAIALEQWPTSNGLLERVPAHEQAALIPFCELVELRTAEILYEPRRSAGVRLFSPLRHDFRSSRSCMTGALWRR